MNIISEVGSLTNWLAPKGWTLVGFEGEDKHFFFGGSEMAGMMLVYEGKGTLIFYGRGETCKVEVEAVEMEKWLFHVLSPSVNPDFYHEVLEWKRVNRHG